MVGLGETDEEILEVMRDMRAHGVDMLTIGQYLSPSTHHLPVLRYVHPDGVQDVRSAGTDAGIHARGRSARWCARATTPTGRRRRRRRARRVSAHRCVRPPQGVAMDRRDCLVHARVWRSAAPRRARAANLTRSRCRDGIRTALERGALSAVALLGKSDGFLANPKVRIPLPGYLEDAGNCCASLARQSC